MWPRESRHGVTWVACVVTAVARRNIGSGAQPVNCSECPQEVVGVKSSQVITTGYSRQCSLFINTLAALVFCWDDVISCFSLSQYIYILHLAATVRKRHWVNQVVAPVKMFKPIILVSFLCIFLKWKARFSQHFVIFIFKHFPSCWDQHWLPEWVSDKYKMKPLRQAGGRLWVKMISLLGLGVKRDFICNTRVTAGSLHRAPRLQAPPLNPTSLGGTDHSVQEGLCAIRTWSGNRPLAHTVPFPTSTLACSVWMEVQNWWHPSESTQRSSRLSI